MNEELTLLSESPERTLALGEALGRALQGGDVVALRGDLGAGKTWLTKGIAAGVGVAAEEVTSPTFVLMHIYEGRVRVAHFDAYRLRSAGEMLDLGAEEAFFGAGAAVVEWADRVEGALPEDRLDIEMSVAGERSRQIVARARGARGRRLLAALAG
ncbi:MAG TPA: tRNA (adenosine(37)-N6)-threonylcarbamoyltransferase complex ATPase subunit type 1 TsaE, partial [Candidatus Brocadiia bacterium]|nr:tRNA (adenosine(37)-N6)-threonylcarbamoyltransferase complex ATPase subunit type 1 TsaE [Candidatus Brocadiia bacterium]